MVWLKKDVVDTEWMAKPLLGRLVARLGLNTIPLVAALHPDPRGWMHSVAKLPLGRRRKAPGEAM